MPPAVVTGVITTTPIYAAMVKSRSAVVNNHHVAEISATMNGQRCVAPRAVLYLDTFPGVRERAAVGPPAMILPPTCVVKTR